MSDENDITAAERQITRMLERMDSRDRVRWLRRQAHEYITDLSARIYFKLPCSCDDTEIDPEIEIKELIFGLGRRHNLTIDECTKAYDQQLKLSRKLCAAMGKRILKIGVFHMIGGGSVESLTELFIKERKNFRSYWPHLTPSDYKIIARQFKRRRRQLKAKSP